MLATWAPATAVIHWAVLVEERMLTERFGPGYDEYRRRVPRYLPWPGRSAETRATSAPQ